VWDADLAKINRKSFSSDIRKRETESKSEKSLDSNRWETHPNRRKVFRSHLRSTGNFYRRRRGKRQSGGPFVPEEQGKGGANPGKRTKRNKNVG